VGKLIVEMTMSLDGFVSGPDVRVGQALGRDGERLLHVAAPPLNSLGAV
jgi:hypothetical protein